MSSCIVDLFPSSAECIGTDAHDVRRISTDSVVATRIRIENESGSGTSFWFLYDPNSLVPICIFLD